MINVKQEVVVEGMKCEGCAENVSKLFLTLDGVERVLVDRDAKVAAVEGAREITADEYQQALTDTNYQVVEVK